MKKKQNQPKTGEYGRSKHRRGRLGIRWHIFFLLTGFAVFSMIVVWLFQIGLLNYFYKRIKLGEFKSLYNSVQEDVLAEDEDALNRDALTVAKKSDICVLLVRLQSNGTLEKVVSVDVVPDCAIHHIPDLKLMKLCDEALSRGGTYVGEIVFGEGVITVHEAAFDLADSLKGQKRSGSLVYVRLFQNSDGDPYALMLNSEGFPLDSTRATLFRQFFWIILLMVAGALVTALLLSRRITGPIIRMNRSAHRLAAGDYEVDFAGGGPEYRESEELADSLNYAAGELEKTDQLQKELIANLSHDLRTPLTMIKGYGEVMRDIPGENTPENIQIIIDETTHLTELVNDTLDISRLNAGTQKMEPAVFNLTATVQEILLRYDRLVKHEGYTVEFDYAQEVSVFADRTLMTQVIYNLINNAINYTDESKKVVVRQVVDEAKGEVAIRVEDFGEGISPENLRMIWDRYYKVDQKHKRAKCGTGLGLSIVRGNLELHKARYGVESTVGKGSVFWFALPMVSKDEEPQ